MLRRQVPYPPLPWLNKAISEHKLNHQNSIRKLSYKEISRKRKGSQQKFADIGSYKKQKASKEGTKSRSRYSKDESQERRSVDSRKGKNIPRNHKLKVSYEDTKIHKENLRNNFISTNKVSQNHITNRKIINRICFISQMTEGLTQRRN